MKLLVLAAAALVAAETKARAINDEQAQKYPYMDWAMTLYGLDYTWEGHEVTTNDGYILTMFRVTGDEKGL